VLSHSLDDFLAKTGQGWTLRVLAGGLATRRDNGRNPMVAPLEQGCATAGARESATTAGSGRQGLLICHRV